jgi:hypothetical protein|tara:strand:- start:411 stop:533 length:123 start_codon:yes stop_codon:yes gene_type:complete
MYKIYKANKKSIKKSPGRKQRRKDERLLKKQARRDNGTSI